MHVRNEHGERQKGVLVKQENKKEAQSIGNRVISSIEISRLSYNGTTKSNKNR
jgi:hypothetical protein